MSRNERRRVKLWLIEKREKAVHFATLPENDPDHRKVWIPRSVMGAITQNLPGRGERWFPCQVEVDCWFLEKENI